MKKLFYEFIFFKCLGWKITGAFNASIKKCIYIVVPHTSWHDFYIGLCTRGVLNQQINFVGKKELFVFPIGYLFKYLGGYPLNRGKNENKVEAIARLFQQNEIFRLALSPEGTRKKVTQWRSGFYYMAKIANVPIVPVAFDFKNKQVIVHKQFTPTENKEMDFKYLESLYQGIEGKIKENSFD